MSKEFEKRIEYLSKLGVEDAGYKNEWRPKKPPRKLYNLKIFNTIKLPFSAEEWCSLCMSDGGNYMGGCCGSMSHLQDIMNNIFRFDSGYISCEKLENIAQIMIEHGEEKAATAWKNGKGIVFGELPMPLAKLMPKIKVGSISPWDRIALIWHIVKGHYSPKTPDVFGDHVSDLDRSISILSKGLWNLQIGSLFADREKDKQHKSQTKASRALLLSRLIPAIKTINEKVNELELGDIKGYALIAKERGEDQIAHNNFGLCVFKTKKKVNELIQTWEEQAKLYDEPDSRPAPLKEQFGIRKVQISSEKGIEFLSDLL